MDFQTQVQRCWFNWGERGLRKSALYLYKNSGKEPACQWDMSLIPGWGRSPGGGKVTHSSILAWRTPGTEKPGRLQRVEKSQMWLSTTQLAFVPSNFNFLCLLSFHTVHGILSWFSSLPYHSDHLYLWPLPAFPQFLFWGLVSTFFNDSI